MDTNLYEDIDIIIQEILATFHAQVMDLDFNNINNSLKEKKYFTNSYDMMNREFENIKLKTKIGLSLSNKINNTLSNLYDNKKFESIYNHIVLFLCGDETDLFTSSHTFIRLYIQTNYPHYLFYKYKKIVKSLLIDLGFESEYEFTTHLKSISTYTQLENIFSKLIKWYNQYPISHLQFIKNTFHIIENVKSSENQDILPIIYLLEEYNDKCIGCFRYYLKNEYSGNNNGGGISLVRSIFLHKLCEKHDGFKEFSIADIDEFNKIENKIHHPSYHPFVAKDECNPNKREINKNICYDMCNYHNTLNSYNFHNERARVKMDSIYDYKYIYKCENGSFLSKIGIAIVNYNKKQFSKEKNYITVINKSCKNYWLIIFIIYFIILVIILIANNKKISKLYSN